MIEQVSATQVDAFERCARSWHFRYVQKIKTPQTPAQQRGSAIHKAIENWLLHDSIDPTWGAYVDAVRKHLPEGPRAVEKPFAIQTYEGGPKWIGFIDLLVDTSERLRILDYKTTSDFKYAKTPEELRNNTQMVSYAKWAYEVAPQMPDLEVGHVYLLTKTKIPQSRYVGAILPESIVRPRWQASLQTVRNIVECESAKSADELPPTTSSCDMYGGCPYRSRCGLSAFSWTSKGAPMSTAPTQPSFMDLLTAAHQQNGQSVAVTTSVPAQITQTANGFAVQSNQPGVATVQTLPTGVPAPFGSQVFPSPAAFPPPAPAQQTFPPPVQTFAPPVQTQQLPLPGIQGAPPIVGAEAQAMAAQFGVPLPQGAGFAATVGTVVPAPGVPAQGLLAPDATPRAEIVPAPAQAAAEAVEAPKRRGRPRKVQDGAQEASGEAPSLPAPQFTATFAPPGTPAVPVAPTVRPGVGVDLTIYVDCIPTKGSGPITIFEDFIAPLGQEVAEQAGVPDYRMVPYGGGKALLADAIRRHIGEVPPILVINSMASGAHEALDVLKPYAKFIVQGLRG